MLTAPRERRPWDARDIAAIWPTGAQFAPIELPDIGPDADLITPSQLETQLKRGAAD